MRKMTLNYVTKELPSLAGEVINAAHTYMRIDAPHIREAQPRSFFFCIFVLWADV